MSEHNISLMHYEVIRWVSVSLLLSHIHIATFFTQTLTTLTLLINKIAAVGAQYLADALRNNTVSLILSSSISYTHLHVFTQTLTTLDLNYNQIGDAGAQYLADALRNNTVTLILSSSISYTHRHVFTQTLTTLDLNYMGIGDDLRNEVKELVKRNERMLKSWIVSMIMSWQRSKRTVKFVNSVLFRVFAENEKIKLFYHRCHFIKVIISWHFFLML
jgi:hypothetical protein